MLIEGATPTDLERENERLRAELEAQTLELRRSRARLLAAADAERRRLERDLHDGAQSRFVAAALRLRTAQAKAAPDGELAAMLDEAIGDVMLGIDELRELARGIHPAVLTERGLGPALEALLTRAPIPVEIGGLPDDRLPAQVEAAAYYVVAEAITNVGRYAQASYATVDIARSNGATIVTVSDDGVGGADPASGTGLRGLATRVEALDGHLDIDSAPGRGTRVRAEIPTPH